MLVGLIVSDQWVKRHAAKAGRIPISAPSRETLQGRSARRMGTAEEFANLACFLASEQGSYIPAPPSMSMAAVHRWCRRGVQKQKTSVTGAFSFKPRPWRP